MTRRKENKDSEVKPIRFSEIRKLAGRERVLEALNANYLGGQVAGCEIQIDDVEWESYNNKVYAVAKVMVLGCEDNDEVKEGEYVRVAFSGRVISDQLKLAEKYLRRGKPVIAKVEVRESKNGRRYLVLA